MNDSVLAICIKAKKGQPMKTQPCELHFRKLSSTVFNFKCPTSSAEQQILLEVCSDQF